MSDEADLAAELANAAIDAGLRAIDPIIPVGVAGDCAECGETMPRLVGGRCGFCRDGRRPPLSRFESIPVPEIRAMPNPPPSANFHVISVRAEGEALRAIRERADRDELALGRAALVLIEEALTAASATPMARIVPGEPREAEPLTAASLTTVPIEWLTDELARRLAEAAPAVERDAAIARAEAAEGQLATVKLRLGQVLADVEGDAA